MRVGLGIGHLSPPALPAPDRAKAQRGSSPERERQVKPSPFILRPFTALTPYPATVHTMAGPFADLLASGPWAIDGGLASELEGLGHDLSGSLWSARLIRDRPEAIVAIHAAY